MAPLWKRWNKVRTTNQPNGHFALVACWTFLEIQDEEEQDCWVNTCLIVWLYMLEFCLRSGILFESVCSITEMKLLLFLCTGSITPIRYYLSLHTTEYADKTRVSRWSSSISAVKMWWVDLLSLRKPHSASKIQTTYTKMEKRAKAAGAVGSATNLQQVGTDINMQMLRNFSFYGSTV